MASSMPKPKTTERGYLCRERRWLQRQKRLLPKNIEGRVECYGCPVENVEQVQTKAGD